ncbi:hypothetical protein LEMLEM_LOCUS12087, partial [Lemmus lemmus]
GGRIARTVIEGRRSRAERSGRRRAGRAESADAESKAGGRAPAAGRRGRAESQSLPRRRAAHRRVPACAQSPSGGHLYLPSPRGCEIPGTGHLAIASCGAPLLGPRGGGRAGCEACGFLKKLAPGRTISSRHASLRIDSTSLSPPSTPRRPRQALGGRRGSGLKSAPPVLVPAPSRRPLPLRDSKLPGDYVSERNPARKYMHSLRIAGARAQRHKV